MATNITSLKFDDGETITVVGVDQHEMECTAIDFSNPNGVMIEYVDVATPMRLFLPWHFIQSINQEL